MKIGAGLSQEQSLKLHLSQELKQAITLLQYSSAELMQYIQELALDNPLIEIKENSELSVFYHKKNPQGKSGAANLIELVHDRSASLADHLHSQLRMTKASGSVLAGARLLIEQLDENGYLTKDAVVLLGGAGLSVSEAQCSLLALQSLEPAGVGARTLQECLLLQIERIKERPELAINVIRDHFMLFAERSWKTAAKLANCRLEDIQEVYDFIQTLNPKPGSVYGGNQTSYVIPDLVVKCSEGSWEAGCNDEALPEIGISPVYKKLKGSSEERELKKYLTEKQQQCIWLVKTIDQRKETMVKVMKEILAVQHRFFRTGKQETLKPLTLSDLSEACGIHESTVSRTLRGKYVQTPFGTLEMKSFLTNKISSENEAGQSAAGAKEMLARLVRDEDKTSPLSDQMIAAVLLERHDLKLSRRTVAKYRDQLKIPSSSRRRRYTEAGND
ncbi:RNA polymerase factor sigma-54 [Metabacillus sp. 84]|uniref:RNA polymerase factor sigma-54 n=1 Tax=Metabacillus sp. 84 TaxID=3404705 RepID=UPI003CF3998F